MSKLKSYSVDELRKIDDKEHADYVGRGRYIVTFHPYSYINHSCEPNILLKHLTIAKSEFFAMRKIKKGEELTIDYGVNAMDQIDKNIWTINCKCGSKNCRKKIKGGFFFQPKDIRKRYYKYLPPSIKRKFKEKLRSLR